eukprot:1418819-Pleurochrysis_carterae.AAC.1
MATRPSASATATEHSSSHSISCDASSDCTSIGPSPPGASSQSLPSTSVSPDTGIASSGSCVSAATSTSMFPDVTDFTKPCRMSALFTTLSSLSRSLHSQEWPPPAA